ncbi:hypothetical protein CEK28_03800 [Xenophilus sp. AP218F]|nr:hypothetical protein CEK28_03800 [Xenophilus sp. AP218F]
MMREREVNTMGYTVGIIKEIAEQLKELPVMEESSREISKQEAINLLADEIKELQTRKNYTFDQIAEVLSKRGLQITGKTLKTYLSRSRNAGRKPKSTRPKTMKTTKTETKQDSNSQEQVVQQVDTKPGQVENRVDIHKRASSFELNPDTDEL